MKRFWVRINNWNKQAVTTALEQGAEAIVLPSELVEKVKEQQNGEVNEQEARESNRSKAIHNLKRYLVLQEIQKQNNIRITDEEINSHIDLLADRYRTNPRKLRRHLKENGRYSEIIEEMRERKILEFLRNSARITEKKIPYSSASKIVTL